jgi:uncharacterized membrane protein
MAGIGFELKKLSNQGSISALLSAGGHATVIAAGPWLFTILSLATISVSVEALIGLEVLGTFRALVIYAFAVSLVTTAPVTIVATRLVADSLWARKPERVGTLLFATFLVAAACAGIGAALVAVMLSVPIALAIPLIAATITVALIWVALGFCGAVRDYHAVTIAFALGLVVSVAASILAAAAGGDAAAMAFGFTAGLMVTWLGLTSRVMATFPHPVADLQQGLAALRTGAREYGDLALGALAGTAAVWVDKWVFWMSPVGETVKGGLIHAPLYDSAMFIASLVIIPSLASFVAKLETDFFERYQQYYGSIKNHGTLSEIESARQRMSSETLDMLVLITVAQVGLCAVLIMTAPLLVSALNLQFGQIAILRFGALAAVFQFIFIATTSFILFFDRRHVYLGLQLLFFVTNIGFSLLTLWLGRDFYGVGYFAACLVSSLAAYMMATATFERLNFLTFIGNNPSVKASADTNIGRLS